MSRGSIGLTDHLNAYLVASEPPEHPVLARLRDLTGNLPQGGMQIAPEQGHLLAFLVHLTATKRALEIGTFTGYSALTVALALPADGTLVALDVSKEWTDIARRHWIDAGVADKIELRLGPALVTLATLEQELAAASFDFAFIDADKDNYDAYYETALRLVRIGGLIVFDNMLQRGRVADPQQTDANTAAIRSLNAKIAADERVDRVLLPVGDGMTLVRRRG